VDRSFDELIAEYESAHDKYSWSAYLASTWSSSAFHPFIDGNGRIGRVLIHLQLAKLGYPPVIIRKQRASADHYYPALTAFYP
jgi:fido (protein-threonine AMPylation protein)